jgi:DDE family transposase
MGTLSKIWNSIQYELFPWLEEEFDPLTEKQHEFIRVIELMNLSVHMGPYQGCGIGRTLKNRTSIAMAFVAKAVYDFTTTKMLLEYLHGNENLRRLCGWETKLEIPSAPTFSRAFNEFAIGELPQKIHEAMVKKHCGDKLVGHISRDSTAIKAREKPAKKEPKKKGPKKKPGRPRSDDVREPKPSKRLDIQPDQSLEENLKELPNKCNVGTKKNSKGRQSSWVGYKLHIDCADGDIPISAILSSASLHDSQAAIPLAQMSSQRVESLYDLMDAAYDASGIHSFSKALGHVPIIDHNPGRSGKKRQMESFTKARYAQRSSVERVNSYLKDSHGGRNIRVKGPSKVMAHLMFGIIAITVNQLFNLLV